jgi:hypothetical protein
MATKKGEGESDVISQAAATSCIHVPTVETADAIHRVRNTGCRRGLQVEAEVRAEEVIGEAGEFNEGFGRVTVA